MGLVARYPVSIAVVAAALAAVVGVFAFALPRYHGPETHMVDLTRATHYTPGTVRQVFAAHGIRLRYSNVKQAPSGPLWLSPTPIPVPEDRMYVIFAPPRQKDINWGPSGDGYEKAVGNLLVHYGGADPGTLAAVKAAVAALP